MSKAHDSHACTCPSVDGSLRWPCPVHPPTAQAAPADPMAWPLPCDVTVGHVTMRQGVKLSTLVLRMKALYQMATGEDADVVAARTLEERSRMFATFQAQIAATPALPVTEDSSAGDLATESASRLTLEQAEAMAFCSTNEPTALLRYWFRKGYTAAAAQAEVQAEPVPLTGDLIESVDAWFAQNTGLGGCSDKDVAELAAIFAAPQAKLADVQDAKHWRDHIGKLDALVTYCPTCCQGFIAKPEMNRDEVIFECGKTAGRSEVKAKEGN